MKLEGKLSILERERGKKEIEKKKKKKKNLQQGLLLQESARHKGEVGGKRGEE